MPAKVDRLYTTEEFAELAGISPETEREWRRDGRAPAHVRNGAKWIRYAESDIAAWLKDHRVEPQAA